MDTDAILRRSPGIKPITRNKPFTEPHLKNMSEWLYKIWVSRILLLEAGKLESNPDGSVSHEESIYWGNPMKPVTQQRLGCSQWHSFTRWSTIETWRQMENQFTVCSFHCVFPVCVGKNKKWEALHWRTDAFSLKLPSLRQKAAWNMTCSDFTPCSAGLNTTAR